MRIRNQCLRLGGWRVTAGDAAKEKKKSFYSLIISTRAHTPIRTILYKKQPEKKTKSIC